MKRGGGLSGAVSLVTIFCVLCLTVFAVLTLSAADRERRMAETAAERAAAYYEADRQATQWVAERTAAIPASNLPDGAVWASSFPFGESQTLEVEIRYELDAGAYRILRWQTVYSGDWETDDNLEVWGGE